MVFFFQAEDGIRDLVRSRGLGDVYKRQIQALLNLQEITGETKWLKKAKSITSYVIENFNEPETGYVFYTSIQQRDVIVRKKEVYDGAVPSGNSIMAYNLHHLSILFDKKEWEERSLAMILGLGKAIITYPTSFGNWACLLLEMITGTNEIVIMGSDNSGLQAEIHQQYIPHRIIMSSVTANPDFPLLAEKDPGKTPSIFLSIIRQAYSIRFPKKLPFISYVRQGIFLMLSCPLHRRTICRPLKRY